MPEGPEVKRTGHSLSQCISGDILENVEVISGRYLKTQIFGMTEMMENLPSKIVGVGVHGKFLYILMSKGYNIWSTLGMTGRWGKDRTNHSRVKLTMSSGKIYYYSDQRNFGTIKFVYGPHKLKKRLEKLGPDMLCDETTEGVFIDRIRTRRHWNITKVLMAQSIVSGIGNYIKAESLWLAGLSPERTVESMLDVELSALYFAIRAVMIESYNNQGVTHRAHKIFSDVHGDYSCRFLCYGRKLDAEGNDVIKTKTPDGRITHWAPNKQK